MNNTTNYIMSVVNERLVTVGVKKGFDLMTYTNHEGCLFEVSKDKEDNCIELKLTINESDPMETTIYSFFIDVEDLKEISENILCSK